MYTRNEMLAKAITLASTVFEGKTHGKQPYITHLMRVMFAVDQTDPELMAIAILHDLCEDFPNDYPPESLLEMGYSVRVFEAVKALTHEHGEFYDSYIRRVSINRDAVKVKLADLQDNSNITHLKGLTKADFERMERYHKAYTYLSKVTL